MNEEVTWAEAALDACLRHLEVSTITEARHVMVEVAWIDSPDSFCIIYRPPYDPERRVGLRRHRADAKKAANAPYRLGDLAPADYYIEDPAHPTPAAFGDTVADFDLGEPLGNVMRILRLDQDGIGWWGSLASQLPTRPA
jgi:hypothetical protein